MTCLMASTKITSLPPVTEIIVPNPTLSQTHYVVLVGGA
jgi:hypothetical protein